MFFKKKSMWVLNNCESRHQNCSKLNNCLLPKTRGTLKWVCWPDLVHDRVFLEALPILCLSSLWFQWSLFIKGIKERKNTEKEMGSERKWRKERKKKCSEIEREETLPLKTNTFLPHTILSCSYSGVAIQRKTKFLKQSSTCCLYVDTW